MANKKIYEKSLENLMKLGVIKDTPVMSLLFGGLVDNLQAGLKREEEMVEDVDYFIAEDGVKYMGTKENPMLNDGQPVKVEDFINESQEKLNNAERSSDVINTGIGLGGAGLSTFNMAQDNPNMAVGALGGALTGLASGNPINAITGAVTGLFGAGMKSMQNQQQDFEQSREMYENATVQPKSFDLGGGVADLLGENYVPIQAEKGDSGKESLLLPNLDLVKTGADKSHDDMEDEDITDIVPENTYVFSASKDIEVDLKDVAETVIGLGISSYTEQGDNYKGELIKFRDIFGDKGKHTYAELTDKVKSKYPTKYEKEKDIFNEDTNMDNKMSRMPILEQLIGMQEQDKQVMEGGQPQQFKYGGYIKKYDWGSLVYDTYNVMQDALKEGLQGNNTSGAQNTGSDLSANLFKEQENLLDQISAGIEPARQQAEQEYGKFFREEQGRNLLGTTLGLASVFAQPTEVETPRMGTQYISEMYPKPSRADIEMAKAPLRQTQAATINALEQSGLPPSQVVSMLAPLQGQILSQEAQIEQQSRMEARQQDAAKFAKLQQVADYNARQAVNEREQERGLLGQQIATGAGELQRGLTNRGSIRGNELETMRQIEKNYNDNRLNDLLNRQQLAGLKSRMQLMDEQIKQTEKYLNMLKGETVNDNTGETNLGSSVLRESNVVESIDPDKWKKPG